MSEAVKTNRTVKDFMKAAAFLVVGSIALSQGADALGYDADQRAADQQAANEAWVQAYKLK